MTERLTIPKQRLAACDSRSKRSQVWNEADENTTGPASLMVVDPDGNLILVEAYGRVVVFFDLYGNKWDLVQPNED